MEAKIAEKDLKYNVEEYLQYGRNMGKWLFFRLNSGDFIVQEGKSRRRIKGAPKGTADFEVIQRIPGSMQCRTIFLETKSTGGWQRPEQVEFEQKAKAQGAEYYLILSLDELFRILPMEVLIGIEPCGVKRIDDRCDSLKLVCSQKHTPQG